MKFIADVNIAQTVIIFLQQAGHEVTDIKKEDPTASDIKIIQQALKENKIILTHDKDFLALTQYPKYQVGAIVLRLKKQNAQHFCEKLQELLEHQTEEILKKSLTILREESADSYPY